MSQLEAKRVVGQSCWNWSERPTCWVGALLSGQMCGASRGRLAVVADRYPRGAELPSTHPEGGGLSRPWSRALGV